MSNVSSNSPSAPDPSHNAPKVYSGKGAEGQTPGKIDESALLEAAKKLMEEFEKESVMEDAVDALGGGKERTEEDQKKEKLQRSKETKQVLKGEDTQLQTEMFNQAQDKSTSTFNTLVAQLPQLQLPELTRFPMGKDGIGNPWLKPSLATALFQAWLEILPIMMQAKMQETRTEVQNIGRSAEASRHKADATLKIAKLKSEQMMLQAIDQFVQAGIQVAQMVGGAVMQIGGQVINAGISLVNMGIGAVNSAMSMGASAVGGGGGGMELPTLPPIDTKGMNEMLSGGLAAGGKVASGVIKALEAKIELLVGQQEFMKQMWEYIANSAEKMQNAASEGKKAIAEVFASFIQAMLQFIQQEGIHAIKQGGYG